MTLLDSNMWLALTLPGHPCHDVARSWVRDECPPDRFLFCRATQQSFLRSVTTEAVLRPTGNPPLANAEAWNLYRSLLADPRVGFAREPDGLDETWQRLGARDTASPKAWMDAYLAAFAISGGYRLVTTDLAFRDFDGLDLVLLPKP
jgi:uncharacterized protein